MYEDCCYNNNFVDEVICRLDFATSIDELKKSLPKNIYDVVHKDYPIAEPQDVIGTELNINPISGATLNQINSKNWVFRSRDRKNYCSIDSDKVVFSLHSYNVFEDFYDSIIQILTAVMQSFDGCVGKRLGLRYVNNIPIKGNEDWIEDMFLEPFKVLQKSFTTRLLTTSEYCVEEKELNVKLIYGFNNPDYPSPIKKEDFLIDIDAYSTGIIYGEYLRRLVDDMHSEDQDCFEKIITDSFRKTNK